MQTLDEQGVESNVNSVKPTNDAYHTLDFNSPLMQSQAGFQYIVGNYPITQKMMHNLAFNHLDIPFDIAEKSALFDLKVF